MLKAVIFDNDGVLSDSHSEINKLFTELINKNLKLNITEKDFAKHPGMRFEQKAELFAKEKGLKISKKEIDELIEKGRDIYYKDIIKMIKLYPGVVELLKELKQNNIKIGLGTNGSKRTITKLFDNFGLHNYFDSIVTFDDASQGKPHPEIFLKNAENLKVKPEECVVVEDSIEGITAARAAKMKVIAVQTTLKKEELKDADLIVESIEDLNLRKIKSLF
ncbi:MAG: HAD family phosphatase [Candidatus Woesearchaeota archaeon]